MSAKISDSSMQASLEHNAFGTNRPRQLNSELQCSTLHIKYVISKYCTRRRTRIQNFQKTQTQEHQKYYPAISDIYYLHYNIQWCENLRWSNDDKTIFLNTILTNRLRFSKQHLGWEAELIRDGYGGSVALQNYSIAALPSQVQES